MQATAYACNGTNGTGARLLTGHGQPGSGVGDPGQFYTDLDTGITYGPKATAWPQDGINCAGFPHTGIDWHGCNLIGADLFDANLSGDDLSRVTWSNTSCPDGTISNDNGGTCIGHL